MKTGMKRFWSAVLALTLVLGLLPGTVWTVLAEELEALSDSTINMYFDDHLDMTGKTVEIVDAGTPTSYQVGYGIPADTLDTAVVTMKGNTLVATGTGTASVKVDGHIKTVTVTAAPISLLLLIGQSNMQGAEATAKQSIVCPDGQVYSTFGTNTVLNVDNATNFVASALTGSGSLVNVNGTTANLEDYPLNQLTADGDGKLGPDSGYAYEWVKQTGEKVWVVNAAHGASSISTWQKGKDNYNEAVAMFSACQQTLKREIAAGHFTMSHMGYFWCQGCADEQKTAKWYADQYVGMHEALKEALTTDMDGDNVLETLEFSNITAVMAGHVKKTGYRYEEGVYDSADDTFFMTYEELEMRGPRVAQYWLSANPNYPDINMVCNLAESWVTMPDGSDSVAEYFAAHYPNGRVDYTTQVKQKESWHSPTTVAEVKDTIHYNQIGFNEIGREAARNTLILLGEIEDTQEETTVKFVDWTGYREVDSIEALTSGASSTLVFPKVYPCYRAKQVSFKVSEGLRYEYFDLIADSKNVSGMLAATGAASDEVTVTARALGQYRWEMNAEGTDLVNITTGDYKPNKLSAFTTDTILSQIADGKLTKYVAAMENGVILEHDKDWTIEWKASGNWSGMLLCDINGTAENPPAGGNYVFRTTNSTAGSPGVVIGAYKDSTVYASGYGHYGVDKGTLASYFNDTTHTFRLENRILRDLSGNYISNMVYLVIDDAACFEMIQFWNGSTTSSTGDWLNGKDLYIDGIGKGGHPLNNIKLEYLQISEGSECAHAFGAWSTGDAQQRVCSLCGKTEHRTFKNYRWEMNEAGTGLTNVTAGGYDTNALTIKTGTVAGGVLEGVRYEMAHSTILLAEKEWIVEWKGSGNWSGMLLSSAATSSIGVEYFFRSSTTNLLAFGYRHQNEDGTATFRNYGIKNPGIDWNQEHTFRLENRVTVDAQGSYASNMVYLVIDDVEIGALNQYHVLTTSQNKTVNWLNGKNLILNFIGNTGEQTVSGLALEYLEIRTGGMPHQHYYTITSETEGTCSTEGYYTYTCSCGASYTESNGKLGNQHTFGQWYASGDIVRRDCENCDVFETKQWLNYRWEMNEAGNGLVNRADGSYTGNGLTLQTNSKFTNGITNGKLTKFGAALENGVTLKHDKKWVIEWRSSGNWSGMFLCDVTGTSVVPATGGTYLFRTSSTAVGSPGIVIGAYKDADVYADGYGHYGVTKAQIASYMGDTAHTFRLENRVVEDGAGNYVSNMVYLVIDGGEGLPMTNFWNSSTTSSTDTWLNGKDLYFDGIGTSGHPLNGITLEYLEIMVNGECAHTYSAWTVVDGMKQRVCSSCGKIENSDLEVFRWEMSEEGNALVSRDDGCYTDNDLILQTSTRFTNDITNGTLTKFGVTMTAGVTLKHDEPWVIEWKGSGNWSGMFLCDVNGTSQYPAVGGDYIFRTGGTAVGSPGLTIGAYKDTSANADGYGHYGVTKTQIAAYMGSATHTFRLENRIAVNEQGGYASNMVYLVIDGGEGIEMTNYWGGTSTTTSTGTWLNGQDLYFDGIGTAGHPLSGITLEYLEIMVHGECDHNYGAWTITDGKEQRECANCGKIESNKLENFRWEMSETGSDLVSVTTDGYSENVLTLEKGSVTDGVFNSVLYTMANAVTLQYDKEWIIQWKASGDWSGMLLSTLDNTKYNPSIGGNYIFRTGSTSVNAPGLAFGVYKDISANPGGFGHVGANKGQLQTYMDDTPRTFRLENRVMLDDQGGYVSNMVYLVIDGFTDIPMSTAWDAPVDWLSGQDLTFEAMGTGQHLLNNIKLEYLQINSYSTEHQHAFTPTDTKVYGDCQTEGYVVYQCRCGEETDVSLGMGDHKFGKWVIIDDEREHTCTICEFTERFLIGTHYDASISKGYYTVISQKNYILCDGVTESEIILNNQDGSRRQVMHVLDVDTSNPNVEILPGYYGIDKDLTDPDNWSSTTVEQTMDYYRDELGYNVVAGMNTALNYSSDAPFSFLVYNGEVLAAPGSIFNSGCEAYLAVMKNEDGTVRCELREISQPLQGNEWQAVSCNFGFYVYDGELTLPDVDRGSGADRSMLGIKADGSLVIVQTDGRNSPYSLGLSHYEKGETMLALGCLWAVNCDGGGSSQILTKREGESDYVLRNIPSDGTPRATINSIIIASKASADGVFDHVSMLSKDAYITPNSSVKVDVKGVDGAGMPAQIPADVTYVATGGSFANGVFTSDGTLGEQTVKAYYEGEEVGSVSIHVVIPTSIEFDNAAMAVPYGQSVEIPISAYYGPFEVALGDADISFALSADVGTVNGLIFTARNAENAGQMDTAELTATLVHNTELTAKIPVYVGKGSEVLYDFEDQDLHGWYRSTASNYNSIRVGGDTYLVDSTNGRVHSGDYAMAVEMDFSNSLEAGFQLATLVPREKIVLENAMTIGMWLYVPDEADAVRIDVQAPIYYSKELAVSTGYLTPTPGIMDGGETTITEVGFVSAFDESGWHYITIDLSSEEFTGLPTLKFYISMKDGKNGYVYGQQHNANGKYIFYVDDITVDYSRAVEDRESPVFGDVTYQTSDMNQAEVLSGNTIFSSTVSIFTTVADNMVMNNYSGMDNGSVMAYIDGVDYTEFLSCTGQTELTLSLSDIVLSKGMHTVKFVACDNMGNRSAIVKTIVVDSADKAAVKVVAHDPNADRILTGSLYYIDVVADNPETISSVTVTLDLNNISHWQLDHMEVAKGFEATYTLVKDENIATIVITSVGDTDLSGEDQVLVSIPIRTWELPIVEPIYGHNGEVYMYDDYKAINSILPMDLNVEIDAGYVVYKDGSSDSFTSPKIQVDTELSGNSNTSSGSASLNYIGDKEWYASWNGGHDHRPETKQYYDEGSTNHVDAIALEDKAPTCTETGYTGRTYCEVCHSVVDWGTTIPASHTYELIGGVMKCSGCGELCNGIFEGVEYVDGIKLVGWVGYSYYADGVKLTGVRKAPAPNESGEFYYDFGEDGVCKNYNKYTGMFKDGDVYRYAYIGVLASGWQIVGEEYYYFSDTTMANVSGTVNVDGIDFDFAEDGRLLSGEWVDTPNGKQYYYGPAYYIKTWAEIDGNWYFFRDGYLQTGIAKVLKFGIAGENLWADLGEDGIFTGVYYTGWFTDDEGVVCYAIDGVRQIGLLNIDGDYYFLGYSGYATGSYYAWETHCDLPCGTYEFGTDGKMLRGIVEKDGDLYYYVNGKIGTAGLTKIGEDYYFVSSTGRLATGKYYAWATNCDLPCGNYEFGADGKMINPPVVDPDEPTDPDEPEVKNGLVQEERGIFYYVNGEIGPAGLTKIDGDYYFVSSIGRVATGTYNCWATNCDLPCGTYTFGADGKMIDPPGGSDGVKNGLVQEENGIYYYVDGKIGPAGLTKIGKDYYFVSSIGRVATGTYNCWATNCELPCGVYEFGPDGKMIKNGLFVEERGIFYYVDGEIGPAGLTKIDGYYYFVSSIGRVATGTYNCWATNCDLPCGTYTFDAEGKMIDPPVSEPTSGLVEKEDGIYYYENGKIGKAGLTKIDGDYYFVSSIGRVATGTYNCWATNCDLPCGTYTFGADGKMIDPPVSDPDEPVLNGLVEKEDGIYYYVDGKIGPAGLTKIDGYYYFVSSIGRVATGTYNCWATNCELPCGTYTFGADGKMIDPPAQEPEEPDVPDVPEDPDTPVKNGIVTEGDTMYYYVDGEKTYAGLIEIDGAYYYVNSKFIVVTGSYSITKTNDLMPAGKYTFGADGKMLRGLVQMEDGIYYYVDGKIAPAGLTKIDGDYYFVSSIGRVATGTYNCWATNCDLPCGTYEFGADGKMLNPPVAE